MLKLVKLSIFRTLFMSLFCFAASNTHALVVKGVSTDSGGTSTSTTGTTSSCIGAPTSGKYSSASYSGSSGCVTATPGIDSDGDTMGDTWEDSNGLLKYDPTDRYADNDGDGSSNAREKAKNTKPTTAGATACLGFSTTTATDADCDGVTDSDDPDPTNASVTTLTVNGTYKGGKVTSSDTAH